MEGARDNAEEEREREEMSERKKKEKAHLNKNKFFIHADNFSYSGMEGYGRSVS